MTTIAQDAQGIATTVRTWRSSHLAPALGTTPALQTATTGLLAAATTARQAIATEAATNTALAAARTTLIAAARAYRVKIATLDQDGGNIEANEGAAYRQALAAWSQAVAAAASLASSQAAVVSARTAWQGALGAAAASNASLTNLPQQAVTSQAALDTRLKVLPPLVTFPIQLSLQANRSGAVALNGATVAGTIYPFLPANTAISQVRYFLDDPTRAGTPFKVETGAPYDFNGGTSTAATGYNTTLLSNGTHTITGEVTTTSSTIVVSTATFTVANAAPPPPSSRPTWSAMPFLGTYTKKYISNSSKTADGGGGKIEVIPTEEITGGYGPVTIKNAEVAVCTGGLQVRHTRKLPETGITSGTRQEYEYWATSANSGLNNNSIGADSAMQHKALTFVNVKQGYLEGAYIAGEVQNSSSKWCLSEGIQIYCSTGIATWSGDTPPPYTVTIVNSRITGVHNPASDQNNAYYNHCDLIQLMAGGLRLWNVTLIDSDFQGIYAGREHSNYLGHIYMGRVNFAGVRNNTFYILAVNGKVGKRLFYACDDVYIEDDPRTGANNVHWSPTGIPSTITSTYYRFGTEAEPMIPSGTTFLKGAPPGGDFAPANKVGLNYDPSYFS